MQPYIFPYIGYFQLIHAVDTFVFYDDVNFIKGGWINRNRLLINGAERLVTFPCLGASQNKLINQVVIDSNSRSYRKILNSIQFNYQKALYFSEVYAILNSVLKNENVTIANLAGQSIVSVLNYLNIKKNIKYSSEEFSDTRGLDKAERLIKISRALNAEVYVNSIGGRDLYRREDFAEFNIKLKFLEPCLKSYGQFSSPGITNLSIIDVLMFNSKDEVLDLMSNYILT